jgi:hypothetical protein
MRYRSCPHCGEVNLISADKCWECFQPLPEVPPGSMRASPVSRLALGNAFRQLASSERSELCCSGCGENNPVEAVMCWACYTPVHAPFRQRVYYRARSFWHGVRFRNKRPEPTKEEALLGDDPVSMILWTIIRYAVKDHAGQILVEPQIVETPVNATQPQLSGHRAVFGENGIGVRVLYRNDAIWNEQMKIPAYVLEPLYDDVRSRSAAGLQRNGEGRIAFNWQGVSYNLKVNFIAVDCGEMLSMTFQ